MYKKKPVFLTDGKGGIYKIEKLIKGAILKNLETGERLTVEHPPSGFAVIDMPNVKDAPDKSSQTCPEGDESKPHKVYKRRKNKLSQYFGVTLDKKTGKYKTGLWVNGKVISVGSAFPTEAEAAKAVDDRLEKEGLPKRNFP